MPPTQAVQAWLRSGGHRDNLLESAAQFAGIGIAGPYVTLLACATALPEPPLPALVQPLPQPGAAPGAVAGPLHP